VVISSNVGPILTVSEILPVIAAKPLQMETWLLLTVGSALSDGTIADHLQLTVWPQYRTILALQGHPRSMIAMSFESQYATPYL